MSPERGGFLTMKDVLPIGRICKSCCGPLLRLCVDIVVSDAKNMNTIRNDYVGFAYVTFNPMLYLESLKSVVLGKVPFYRFLHNDCAA